MAVKPLRPGTPPVVRTDFVPGTLVSKSKAGPRSNSGRVERGRNEHGDFAWTNFPRRQILAIPLGFGRSQLWRRLKSLTSRSASLASAMASSELVPVPTQPGMSGNRTPQRSSLLRPSPLRGAGRQCDRHPQTDWHERLIIRHRKHDLAKLPRPITGERIIHDRAACRIRPPRRPQVPSRRPPRCGRAGGCILSRHRAHPRRRARDAGYHPPR